MMMFTRSGMFLFMATILKQYFIVTQSDLVDRFLNGNANKIFLEFINTKGISMYFHKSS